MFINVLEFGAMPDSNYLNTGAFKSAIQHASQLGGGIVYVPPGRYVSGAITLENNVYLHLASGAEVVASENYSDFSEASSSVVAEGSHNAFVFAKGRKNIGIEGKGTLNGNGPAYHDEQADELGYRQPKDKRIRTLVFEDCEDVSLKDITVKDSPMWTLHLVSCNRGKISNVKVINNLRYTNTDAIDIDGCSDIHVTGCYLVTADDGVCIKTTRKPKSIDRPCKNILVDGCIIYSHSSSLKIGTESYNEINNVKFSNCIISKSNRGLAVVSRDGGNIKNVMFTDISIETEFSLPCHWGKADPIYITAKRRHTDRPCGMISDVVFYNIYIQTPGAMNFHSENVELVRNIIISNVTMNQFGITHPDRGTYDLRPPCHPKQTHNIGMHNAYTILDGESRPWGVWEYPGGLPAAYINNINEEDITFENCNLSQENGYDWNPKKIVFIRD